MKSIIIGLICVMGANILLGATVSTFKCEFKVKKLLCGCFKAFCIVLACILMYLCGELNPTLMIASIGGVNMNLGEAMQAIFVLGIVFYGYKDLIKIKELLGVTIDIGEVKKEDVVVVPKNNNIKGESDE